METLMLIIKIVMLVLFVILVVGMYQAITDPTQGTRKHKV
jgi:hypothetical protein